MICSYWDVFLYRNKLPSQLDNGYHVGQILSCDDHPLLVGISLKTCTTKSGFFILLLIAYIANISQNEMNRVHRLFVKMIGSLGIGEEGYLNSLQVDFVVFCTATC